MLTLGQFAYALGAPTKWVQNTWAVLGLDPIYNEAELWRLALVRLLDRAMEVPLKQAYAMALEATPHAGLGRVMELRLVEEGPLDVSVDWARFSSEVLAGLSRSRANRFAHVRIRYRTPTQLGLLERFHRTLKEEGVYWRLYQSVAHARECLATFHHRYNHLRPH